MTLPIFLISYIMFFALSIPIHELGHLIFGIITGYHFSSFRLFNLVWVKEDGVINYKKSRNNFIAGQCLMTPPEDEKDFKFILYNLGGGLLNFIVAIILFICAVIFVMSKNLFFFFWAGTTVNIIIGMMNLIPMSFSVPNDGMNVLTALKSEQARHGFYLMLHANHETTQGKRYRDFDDSIFVVKEPTDYNNYFVANTVISEAARLYDLGKYDESIQVYDVLDLNKVQSYYRNNIKLDNMYYYIVHRPDFDKVKEIYSDPKVKKFLKMSIPTITRVLSAYEFFINDDKEKGMELIEKAKKEIESYPNKGFVLMENDYLMELEEKMICEAS